ncbi:CdaR family transcriptional regulator [Cellulomonas sp. C5510]|uniref:PucR family transcriptional regulator n=1 Tax=Cellulomonas sp. C5510 TaxID=2871170 RepID=UPI001C96F1F4|nr:helix-turn-helix domain-containing protein [Cellulomonas sp. C5510]QZN84747.1 helix-turn-helix domain-containing protein [Cellulomonas sp. C5510]
MARTPEAVLRVARSMVADFEGIIGEVTDRVWRSVPAYPQVVVDRADLSGQVRDSILNVLVCLMEDRAPSAAELDTAAANGERRALQGVAQAAVIQSYRNAERSLVDTFQARCARMQVPVGALRAGQQQIVAILDQLEGAMLRTYAQMQQRIATRTVLTEPDLMNRLVSGEPIDAADLAGLVRTLGLEVTDTTRVVGLALGVAGEDDVDPEHVAELRHHAVAHLQSVTGSAPLSGVVREDDGRPVVVVAVPWEGPVTELGGRLAAGLDRRRTAVAAIGAVGEPRRGLAAVGGSCRQATGALEVGRRRGAERAVVLFRDVLLEVLALRDVRMVVNIQDRYLRPIAAHEHLLETLRVHLATDLSVPETARRLVVHPNTVSYRLRRISELSGLDLHRVADVARAVLAVEGLGLGISARANGSAALDEDPVGR